MQAFSLGYLDAVKGSPVEEDDLVDGETATQISEAALECIDRSATMLKANIIENPEQCHQEIYRAGRLAGQQAEALWMQRN